MRSKIETVERTVCFNKRERWRSRPVFKGYAIPYTTVIGDDGSPNFQAIDEQRVLDCAVNHKCGVCGESLVTGEDEWMAFIGGEKCAKNFAFVDPAMHPECAYFAAETCPYLKNADGEYSKTPNMKGPDGAQIAVLDAVDKVRPPRMMILFVKGYQLVAKNGTLLLIAKHKQHLIDWDAMPPSDPS